MKGTATETVKGALDALLKAITQQAAAAVAGEAAQSRYVTIPRAAALTGLTAKAIERKIEEGYWTEGAEFIKGPDGRRYVDMRGYERWVESA